MSAFVIVDISVKNEMAYQEYIAEITPSVAAYNGKYLVRGGKPQTLDGNWQSSRIVIMEYPTLFQTCCKYVLTTRTEGKDTLHFKPSPARTRVTV